MKMKIKHSIQMLVLIAIGLSSSMEMYAQCEPWQGSADRENLMNSYVIYRDLLKEGDHEKAFRYWEIVYKRAPAADGERNTVYSDGIKFYIDQFNRKKRRKRKKVLVKSIHRLIAEQQQCYPASEVIPLPKEIIEFRSEV